MVRLGRSRYSRKYPVKKTALNRGGTVEGRGGGGKETEIG